MSLLAKDLGNKDLHLVQTSALGSGSFGSVYLTRHSTDKQLYAIKVINIPEYVKHYTYNPLHKTIFELKQEVCEFLARFNSPYVVSYKDCWIGGEQAEYYKELEKTENTSKSQTEEDVSSHTIVPEAWLCIKMGYCRSNLREWLNKNNTLELRKPHVPFVFKQILKGLEYIHSLGVIHRDIKPGNILIKDELSIQIGDFGLSIKFLESDNSKCEPIGTEMYRSPEMIKCKVKSDYNCKSDIYSAGLVFLELVTLTLDTWEKREEAFKLVRDGLYEYSSESCGSELIKLMTIKDFSKGQRPSATRALDLLYKIFPELLRKATEQSHSMQKNDESFSPNDASKALSNDLINKTESSKLLDRKTSAPPPPSSSSSSKWPLIFNIRKVNKKYVGRADELSQLEQIQESQSDNIVVISGLGGIGKSELARKFAHNLFNKGEISCIWFNGETPQSLHASITDLAQKLNIPIVNSANKPREINEMMADVLNLAQQNVEKSKFLLIILDNVDSLNEDLTSLLELIYEVENTFNTLVILTTRNIGICDNSMKLISLEKWSDEDATQFVKNTLQIQEDDDSNLISKLCKKLGNHPLAMNQAVAYIIEQKRTSTTGLTYGISEYLVEFKATAKKLLNYKLSPIAYKDIKPTFVTWDITVSKIKTNYADIGTWACDLLNQMAYFDANGIPQPLLERANSSFENDPKLKSVLNQAVKLLKKYSLIKCESDVVYIHRLVQQVSRIKLQSSWYQEFLTLLILTYNLAKDESLTLTEVTHLQCVWTYASQIDSIVKLLGGTPMLIMSVLNQLGYYNQMLKFSEKNLQKLRQVFGDNHKQTLILKSYLAIAFKSNLNTKSFSMYMEAFENLVEIGELSMALDIAIGLIGDLIDANKSDEAMTLSEFVLRIRRQTLGDDHEKTMSAKCTYATVLIQIGKLEEAMRMFKEVEEWNERHLGQFNEKTIVTRRLMEHCLIRQEKFAEAKEVCENVINGYTVLVGEQHPKTLEQMSFLATLLCVLDEVEKGRQLQEQVVTKLENILGINHPLTVEFQAKLVEIGKLADELQEIRDNGLSLGLSQTEIEDQLATRRRKIVRTIMPNE